MPGRADEYRKEQRAGTPRRDPSIKGFIKKTSRDTGYRKAAQFLM